MAVIDFPSSPTVGQSFTAGNVAWIWDGTKWGVPTTAGSSLYLPLSGGVMTGDITLKGDPTAPLHPVTYRMIGNPNDNRIINGDMRIDQRNNGASGTANGYMVDRWQYSTGIPGKITWQQGNSGLLPFPKCLNILTTSAYTPLAADVFQIFQPIEADFVSDFAWGGANAQPVTLSFWAYSTLAGTYGGAIRNGVGNRSCPFSYSISAANTWTKIAVTIPGDTAGTWVMSGNAVALHVVFDLGAGATYRGPVGVWASTYLVGATGSVNVVAANGASFNVTGVKLEIGSVATPFNRQSLAKSLADCQRYYFDPANGAATPLAFTIGGPSPAVTSYTTAPIVLPTAMRATPTIVVRNQNYGGTNAVSISPITPQTLTTGMTTTSAGPGNAFVQFNLSASAEL